MPRLNQVKIYPTSSNLRDLRMKHPEGHNKKAAGILRKIRRQRIQRRRNLYLRNLRRRPRPTQEVPEVILISTNEKPRTEDRATYRRSKASLYSLE